MHDAVLALQSNKFFKQITVKFFYQSFSANERFKYLIFKTIEFGSFV